MLRAHKYLLWILAALGTVLMPGVGTGAGASVGGKIGEGLNKLFSK